MGYPSDDTFDAAHRGPAKPRSKEELATAYFLKEVHTEVCRARAKFPENDLKFPALIEEVGEVAKALLESERGLVGTGEVYRELVQTACMCLRLATEGDARYNSGLSFPATANADTPFQENPDE